MLTVLLQPCEAPKWLSRMGQRPKCWPFTVILCGECIVCTNVNLSPFISSGVNGNGTMCVLFCTVSLS